MFCSSNPDSFHVGVFVKTLKIFFYYLFLNLVAEGGCIKWIAPGPVMTYSRHCQLAISYDDERQLTWPCYLSTVGFHSVKCHGVAPGRAHPQSSLLCLGKAVIRLQSMLHYSNGARADAHIRNLMLHRK